MDTKKQENPSGTFNEHAFHVSLKDKNRRVNFPLLDFYGFPCITCCGVYGDEYEPLIPNVIIELPIGSLLNYRQSIISSEEEISVFNEELDLLTKSIDPSLPTDFYLMVHPKPKSNICQHFECDNTNEISIMFHPWVLQNQQIKRDLEMAEIAHVGLFCPSDNVVPVHQDIVEEPSRGMPFNQVECRSICIHDMKFSPANCQLQLLEDQECYSFFTICRYQNRQILAFHVLPQNEDIEKQIEEKIKNSNTLGQLLSSLDSVAPAMTNAVKIMRMFIENSFKQVDENFVKQLEQDFREAEHEFAETNKGSLNLAYIF